GGRLGVTGRLPEAEAAYAEALALRKRLAADFPALPACRRDLAASHRELGILFRITGRPKEAEVSLAAALALYQRLAADLPARPEFRLGLARSQHGLGHLLSNTGRLPE